MFALIKNLAGILRKYFFLIILVCISISFFYFDVYRYLSLDLLKQYQFEVEQLMKMHYLMAPALFILIFSALIACAIPCATFFTLIGGFLFGMKAIIYSLFSITLGGMILFIIVRRTLGSRMIHAQTGWLKKIEKGFKKNSFYYLLALRLVPVFPCWISNVGAGIFNLRLPTFVGATLLGILPSTVIYALAGRGLDKLLAQNKPIQDILLTPSVFLPLIGLAILSLIPVIYNGLSASGKESQ